MIEQVLNLIRERKDLLEFELNDYTGLGDPDSENSVEAVELRAQIVLLEELWNEIKSFN